MGHQGKNAAGFSCRANLCRTEGLLIVWGKFAEKHCVFESAWFCSCFSSRFFLGWKSWKKRATCKTDFCNLAQDMFCPRRRVGLRAMASCMASV